eukprot:TRINITY_DN3519_c0_g1_i1.p1 TRINITY_DN3519_c0_g1~~TRINITY_DN3519_c0_g1_i1.p1  ORF type:complete len:620 (-),score=227.58 TRINITY_DN3519_c0_g1_i1:862-2583(-)
MWERSREYLDKIPRQFQTSRAQKVNQANQIVKALKELGYTDDLSYHNLLYPNPLDTRRVLGWLLSQIPKETNVSDSTSALNQKMEDEIDFLMSNSCVWVPEFCNASLPRQQNFYKHTKLSTSSLYNPFTPVFYNNTKTPSQDQKTYFNSSMPLISSQTTRAGFACSVLEYNTRHFTDAQERDNEWNNLGLASGLSQGDYAKDKQRKILSRMADYIRSANAANKNNDAQSMDNLMKAIGQKGEDNRIDRDTKFRKDEKEVEEKGVTEEELAKIREKEKEDIEKALASLEAKIAQGEQFIQVASTEILQLTAALQKEAEKTAELKKKFQDVKQTVDLLANAEENIESLKEKANASKLRLLEIANKWEEIRAPLVEQFRSLKDQYSKREVEIAKKLEEIKQMREEIKGFKSTLQKKDEKHKQLLEILKGVPKENRANYTNKILVLVGGVKKQRVEISKILVDMRNVQKEINMISEKLNRTFAVVEEMIFQDAKKDPTGAQTYKVVARLNDIFKELIEVVTKTGQTANLSLHLTDKIDKLQTRTTALNMQQMEDDLKQVKEENAKLQEKIKEFKKKD